jgi:hypothetical protein
VTPGDGQASVPARLRPRAAPMNIVFLAAFPVWSVIVIAIDVLVIYAVSVHGREVRY